MAGKNKNIEPVTPPTSVAPDSDALRASQGWWAEFKKTVEDPDASVYDFLKGDLRSKLDLEQDEGFVDVLSKAQRKAVKEALGLTQPKELRDALKNLEKNRLFFDARGRTVLKLFRLVMDSYIVALHGETTNTTMNQTEATAIHEQVEALIEEQLGNADVLEKVENLAGELTHIERAEIKETVEEAARQLKDKSTISRMADDALALGKTFMKPDTLTGFAIGSLPIITWKYRWALALGLGAFASRKAVYHTGHSLFSLVKGDVKNARAEGAKAMTALKAAGGNVLSVGLSPAFAKLPRGLTSLGPMVADYAYNKFLDVSHWVLQKKEGDKVSLPKAIVGGVKSFFTKNENSLIAVGAGALKVKLPHKLTMHFEHAVKRVNFPKVRYASKEAFYVGKLLLKRSFNAAVSYAHPKIEDAKSTLGKSFWRSAAPEQDNNKPADIDIDVGVIEAASTVSDPAALAEKPQEHAQKLER